MAEPLINGMAHSWASLKVVLYAYTITGISSVSYSDNEDFKNNYGQGQFPTDRSRGNYEATGSMTIRQYELKKLLQAAGVDRIQDLPMTDLVMAYADPGIPFTSDTLRGVNFKGVKRELSQGDGTVDCEIEFIIGSIDWAKS